LLRYGSMEKISVIIPAYNSAKSLCEAVDSVLAQTYPVHEIIVVDDGSTDNTKEIVTRYARRTTRDVQYIYQANKGPAAARNAGLRVAKGDYIAFLDSDDLWLPEKIEKEMALFKGSNYGMVYCDMSHVVDGKPVYKSYLKEKGYRFFGSGDLYNGLLNENFIFTPTVIIKTEVLKQIGYFDENYRICEDYKMWLSIARNHSIGYLDEPLVIRRRVESNITKDKLLYAVSSVNLLKELMKAENGNPGTKKIIKDRLGKNYFDLGYWYWKRKNFLKGAQCIIASRLLA